MASWLELLLNIIGYGGFVVVATWHPHARAADLSHEIDVEDSRGAMP